MDSRRMRRTEMEDKGLLADILENPDDDAPRLIYADWLDEHARDESDRARAEFIRLQIEDAQRMSEDAPRAVERDLRLDELLRRFGHAWDRELRSLVTPPRYRRGFIESFEAPPDFPENAERIWQLAPIRSVALSGYGSPEAFDHILACPQMARVTQLELLGGQYVLGHLDRLTQSAAGMLRARQLTDLCVSFFY